MQYIELYGIGLAYLQITTCKPPDYELNHSRSYLVKVCHWILQCTEYINFLTFASIGRCCWWIIRIQCWLSALSALYTWHWRSNHKCGCACCSNRRFARHYCCGDTGNHGVVLHQEEQNAGKVSAVILQ